SGDERFFPQDRVIAEKMADPGGQPRVVVVSFPQPSLLYAPLGDFLSEDLGRGGILRLVAILLVAGALCFWMARQIRNPIDKLREATRELANDHLATRVDKAIL